MGRYKLVFKKSVAKDLRKIAKSDIKSILAKFDDLVENPRKERCVKLSAQERYRIRVGLYRVGYEIQDARLVILVVKVGHRSKI